MRCFIAGLILFVGATPIGCGSKTSEASAESPLTAEQWKAMPPDDKYEIATFERLKQSNPKLQEQREWDKFAREVVLPAKKKDFPNGKPTK